MKTAILVLTFVLLSTPFVHADEYGEGFMVFNRLIRDLRSQCAEGELCTQRMTTETVYTHGQADLTRLGQDELAALSTIAHLQAQIWADTILEGDYEAVNQTRLDRVAVLSVDGQKIGFLIEYSQQGWDTSQCRLAAKDPDKLKSCQQGRIVEATFVSADLTSWFADDLQFATFVSL